MRREDAPPVNGFVRRLRDTAGTSIVEAAIITPLLLLLTLSIVDFGALFYVYLALENGVSQATRFGVTGNADGRPVAIPARRCPATTRSSWRCGRPRRR